MSFVPQINDVLVIGGTRYRITEHPALPGSGIPYGQAGRVGTVFQLRGPTGGLVALKVFKSHFRHRSLVAQADLLRPFSDLPGLHTCHRAILAPEFHEDLLRQYPDLTYAALMPWIPGRPWSEIVQTRKPLTRQESGALAAALLGILSRLEREDIAHGDLSGSNLIIDGLETGVPRVELVDVEQIYAPRLPRPENVPAGSPGYAHATARDRPWQADIDRFAGTILLVEILGWCDERVRNAADSQEAIDGGKPDYGETYFNEDEMQQDCPRYRLLHDVLAERWGGGAAALLEQAWFSKMLAECPPFAVGYPGLPDWTPPPPRPPEPDILPNPEPVPDPPPPIRLKWQPVLLLLLALLLLGVGGALALSRPSGNSGVVTPTARTVVETLPADAPATPTQPMPTDKPATEEDSDGDGLSDGQEVQNYSTDPRNPDSDGDGLSDGQEVQNYNTDPSNQDSDSDGLGDREELLDQRTDPNERDSDSDGVSDQVEVTAGSDPLALEPQEESRVTGFRLINPTTGRDLGLIEDGGTINLRQSGCGARGACYLNVESIAADPRVESVKFELDGKPFLINSRSLENTAPYYMAGDTGSGPQRNWDWAGLVGGQHTIEAQPCDRDFGEGECTLPLKVSFTVTR